MAAEKKTDRQKNRPLDFRTNSQQSTLLAHMLDAMIIQRASTMMCRKTIWLVGQIAEGVFINNILIKLYQVRILAAAMGIMTRKTRDPNLTTHPALNMQRVISEAFINQKVGA